MRLGKHIAAQFEMRGKICVKRQYGGLAEIIWTCWDMRVKFKLQTMISFELILTFRS